MMKGMFWAVCLLTFASLISGQEQTRRPTPTISPGRQITSGAIENGRYTNAFFRFSILIPSGWESMTEEEYAERKRRLQIFASKQNSATKEELTAGPSAIPVILRLSPKNDLKGEARTFAILAQDLSGHAPISPEEYLNQSKQAYSGFKALAAASVRTIIFSVKVQI